MFRCVGRVKVQAWKGITVAPWPKPGFRNWESILNYMKCFHHTGTADTSTSTEHEALNVHFRGIIWLVKCRSFEFMSKLKLIKVSLY